jgi:mannose-6-phosphate isomerase-like protein (cupin superfamily)
MHARCLIALSTRLARAPFTGTEVAARVGVCLIRRRLVWPAPGVAASARYRRGMTMYGHTSVTAFAAALPHAWRSRVVARIGGAQIKIVRMDAAPYEAERHDFDELLMVVDGVMELDVGGTAVTVRSGEMYVVPAGVSHAVASGSAGTLVIVDI